MSPLNPGSGGVAGHSQPAQCVLAPCFAIRDDLRQQLVRVEAVLRAGRGPQLYASRRKAEIERHLAELAQPKGC